MENLIDDESHIRSLCKKGLYGAHQEVFLSALNSTLAVIAFLGNVLIIVSLKHVSLHPPSKLLLGCIASTDLCVGLVTQPLFFNLLISPEDSEHCLLSSILIHSIGAIFCAVSLLLLTAISVDRLLALLLGLRYRQVVALRRVWFLVAAFLLSSIALAIIFSIYYRIAVYIMCLIMLLCVLTSTFSYIKNLPDASPSPSSSCSPRTTKRGRNCTQYSEVQKDCVQCNMDVDSISSLLSPVCNCNYIIY